MKSKRGITLVSLVVTIIVLIILAGVSINLTLGENGIITMAKKARENMELATIEEETKLNALYTQIELEDENIGGVDSSSISKLIEFKQKVASAITDMGIETLETANADTMANNIRNISTNKDASSISYDNTNSRLLSTNVQGAVDELDTEMDSLNSSLGNIITLSGKYSCAAREATNITVSNDLEKGVYLACVTVMATAGGKLQTNFAGLTQSTYLPEGINNYCNVTSILNLTTDLVFQVFATEAQTDMPYAIKLIKLA